MSYTLKRALLIYGLLGVLCAFCFGLLALRMYNTQSTAFSFMVWNLFLGGIPILFAMGLRYTTPKSRIGKMTLFTGWMLFFPNSTYMISDLLHLGHVESTIPIWFDASMLFVFAFTGLLMAVVSLRDVHVTLLTNFSKKASWWIIGTCIFLSGFGVYLGRFLRWNSWDIAQDPMGLFYDIGVRFARPIDHWKTWLVTFIFAGILLLAYLFAQWMGPLIQRDQENQSIPTRQLDRH